MPSTAQWIFAPFRLDPDNGCLWYGDEVVVLKPKTFAVLQYLVAHAGQLISKETLLDACWPETAVGDAVLKVCISELRKALRDMVKAPRFIATIHRRGYRFVAQVTRAEASTMGRATTPPLSMTSVLSVTHGPQSTVYHPVAPPVPLVERETALHHLHAALTRAQQGMRQTVFVTGEAGIGKTAVVETFVAQAAAAESLWLACGQCVEHYGTGEAYLPVLDALGQLCGTPGGERLVALLRQNAPTWLAQMPWLLSSADREALQHELQGATRERMLREFAEVVDTLTAESPVMLVIEDLHWSDYATLDLVAFLARRRTPARLLVLGTYRPVEVLVQGHPLRTVTQELRRQGLGTEISLAVLSASAVAGYLEARCPGHGFPDALVPWLHRRTDGNPLFLVTLMAALMARGVIVEREGRWTLVGALEATVGEVPEGLRRLLEQQLERLSAAEQQVVGVASVAGVTFSAATVAAGLEATVASSEEGCDALVRWQVLRPIGLATWPDGTVATRYEFVHALYQQAAYERLGVGQRTRMHQRLGARLEQAYRPQVEEIAVELSVHFERGHDAPRAVRYWQQAAENAVRRSAHQEVIGAVRRALALLSLLSDTPERTRQELGLQTILAQALGATQGFGSLEMEQAYARARELGLQVGDTPQLCTVLWGLWRLYHARGALQTAQQFGEQLLSLAHRQHDPTIFLGAHFALGGSLLFRGECALAHTHASQGLALYDPQYHRTLAFRYGEDPGVGCHAYSALTLWLLGYQAQALTTMHSALALAQEIAHPFSLGRACHWLTLLYLVRGEARPALEQAAAMMALATTQGFPHWAALGTCWHGKALAMQGHSEEGLRQMRQGLAAWHATGAQVGSPVMLALLAEAHGHGGQVDEGLRLLTEAWVVVDRTGERWWEAELHRITGELLLRQEPSDASQAETCFHQALAVARHQQTKFWELRAITSLARLWQRQGKNAVARQLLAEVYGWFTEGFDTADLQAARRLLDALHERP